MTLRLTIPPTVEEAIDVDVEDITVAASVAIDVEEVETIDYRTKSTPIVEALTVV